MMNSYICMCDPDYLFQYNMGSLHWCFHCSSSTNWVTSNIPTEFPLVSFPPLPLPFQQPLFSAPPPNPSFTPSVSDHSFLQDLNYESIILAELTDDKTNLKVPVSVHVCSDMTAVLVFDENPQRTEVDMCSQIAKDERLLAPLVGRDCVVPDEVEHFAFAENLSVESVLISNTIALSSELNSDLGDETEEADMLNPHLDSQLHVIVAGDTIPKSVSLDMSGAFIVTSQLASAPSILSVKLPSFLFDAQGQTLDMVFDRKVFDIKSERDIFATFLGSHITIGSLQHALGLHICNWFDTGQIFWACFDKVNSSVYSVNRVLLFGYSKGFPLLSVDDASDVCDASSVTTTHKMFADMSGRYKYAYSFNLETTRPYTECGSDIMIMDRITLFHKIKCLQLPFDPGVYITHDVVIFFRDMCEDIRSVTHIEYPCISADHTVGAVSASALEKYINAYDFRQYLNFRNFNLSWQPYIDVAFSRSDNSFTLLGLLEQLNTTGEVPVYLWYNSNVEINLTTDVLRSGNWPGLIVFSADQVLHIFVKNQCARTLFGRLENPKRSCSNDLNQRAGVNMNSCISFIHDVLNDESQYEKWNGSVFGSASPTGLNQCLHLSSGHPIVVWVDDCSVIVLWIILEICIRLFCGFMSLEYPITTRLKRSNIFSDDKFPIHKFDHYWIQARMMLEVLTKKAVLFKKVSPKVERAEDFNGAQNKRSTIPYFRKEMLYEQEVYQLDNFHLPLHDQMLLLEGANTMTQTIIDALETAAATRKVTLKAPTIEDIDKTIVAISEQMEIIKMLQEAISSHICAAADFFESELPAANNKKEGSNNALEIMLAGYCPKISPDVFYEMLRKAGGAFNGLKMWSCSQHTIKCSLDTSEIGNRYVVLVTSLEELSHNECMLLGFGFVLGAGRILFKLVEKVAAPWSVFWITETLLMSMPPIHNVLEELDPTIFNTLASPSSSPKKLFDVNLVRHGYILWFEKQNTESLLNVALDHEASKELLSVVNTDKEEQDNTVVSLRLYLNLEDKVLIEEGRIVMNITKKEDPCDKRSNYIWDPGKMPIYRRGK